MSSHKMNIQEKQSEAKTDLFRRIRPFLEPYRKSREKLAAAIGKAFREMDADVGPATLPVVFWKILGGESIFWMENLTPDGNEVPFDVLATAYALWRAAQRAAFRRGLDEVDAAETLTRVAHRIADRLAESDAPGIRNIRNYMFVSYVRELEQAGALPAGVRRKRLKEPMSDDGAFLAALENAILYGELLDAMPPQVRRTIILRYALGCSCDETATTLGSTNRAVRKAVSSGVKKALGACMRELHRLGHARVTRRRKRRERP